MMYTVLELKGTSEFNALTYFHASSNYVQDLRHDMLEGVCKYDIVLPCKNLISSGCITLEVLNRKIQSLN